MKNILITGAAGFIGSSLVDRLLESETEEYRIIAIDNFDPFYSKSVKEANIQPHLTQPNYKFFSLDINDLPSLSEALKDIRIDCIVHLAAKAGVRPSIEDPQGYFQTNVMGTVNMLELAKDHGVKRFVFASSSSVYGKNPNVPWSENDLNLEPISPYASSKIAAEKVCQTYSHLYDLDVIALRFFTVYGPKQRPDLAIHKFFKLASQNKSIPFFGDGTTKRDYTFIDDIVTGITGAITADERTEKFTVYNLGNHQTISLKSLVEAIGSELDTNIQLDIKPMQPGDVKQTFANISKAQADLNYEPKTNITEGLKAFNNWFNQKK